MGLLTAIWATALLMTIGSLAGMSLLIALRFRHDRRTARRLADRGRVEQALIGVMQGRREAEAALGPFRRRARLLAETLLDFIGIVRGEDRQLVVAALASVGADQALRSRIERGSLAGRLASVEALGAFPGPETQFALIRASTRGPEEVRLAALRSLIQAGGEVTAAQLLGELEHQRLSASGQFADLLRMVVDADQAAAVTLIDTPLSPVAQALLLEAIGAAGAYAAIPLLVERAGAGPAGARRAAIQALGRLMHPAAEPAFAAALGDPAWEVRSAAAEAVGAARLTGQADALVARLSDEVWEVRHKAAAALAKLGEIGLGRLRTAAKGKTQSARAASLALGEASP